MQAEKQPNVDLFDLCDMANRTFGSIISFHDMLCVYLDGSDIPGRTRNGIGVMVDDIELKLKSIEGDIKTLMEQNHANKMKQT